MNSSNPKFFFDLGTNLEAQRKFDEAIDAFSKAVALEPNHAEPRVKLGNVLVKAGRPLEALPVLAAALGIKPDHTEAINSLGGALQKLGKFEQAIVCYRKAIALDPASVNPWVNLGSAQASLGEIESAIQCFQRAIKLNPAEAAAHFNLGNAYLGLARLEDALQSFQNALAVNRNYAAAYSNMLYLHALTRDISPEKERDLASMWERCLLTAAERKAARRRSSVTAGVFPATARTNRRLRIGVVSAELGDHAVGEFLEPLLVEMDKSRFHLTLFPTTIKSGERATRLRDLADGFISLIGVPDAQAAERIRSEKIDILIDTTGHTADCRLGIFAHRAAPVQMTYIGYWSTTGLTEMDWYFADPDTPPSMDAHFTERLWRLPRLGTCYRGDRSLPESHWQPSSTIWIGSFNRYSKIREETLSLWAKVLLALPEAKLLLEDRASQELHSHQRILGTLDQHGIAPGSR